MNDVRGRLLEAIDMARHGEGPGQPVLHTVLNGPAVASKLPMVMALLKMVPETTLIEKLDEFRDAIYVIRHGDSG